MTHVLEINAKLDTLKMIEKDIDAAMNAPGVSDLKINERCAYYAACNQMKQSIQRRRKMIV